MITLRNVSINIGGCLITDLTNLVMLKHSTASTTQWATGRTFFASSGYQVPAGKILQMVGYRFQRAAGSNVVLNAVGYGDNDVGFNGSAPTNPITVEPRANIVNTGERVEEGMFIWVPSLKYPAIQSGTGGLDVMTFWLLKDIR